MYRVSGVLMCGALLLLIAGGWRPSTAAAQNGCSPPCRSDFVCQDGNCVSACNPPCAAGQLCRADGECVAQQGQMWVAPSEAQLAAAGRQPSDAGWASVAGVFGLISAAGVAGLTVWAIMERGEPLSSYLGGGALGLLAVAGPITAVGADSARSNPMIEGLPRLRTWSWIGYATSLAGGFGLAVATAVDGDHDLPAGWMALVGGLGAASLVGFAIDALYSASEARSPMGRARPERPRVVPSLALSRDVTGAMAPGLGVGGTF